MKKNKLLVEYEFDFEVFGLRSAAKGYRLAWSINQLWGVHLIKQEDLIIGFKKGLEKGFSYYSYETPVRGIKLVRNKATDEESSNFLFLPECPHFDFIIMVRFEEANLNSQFLELLRQLPDIELVTELDIEKLKSKANFVF